MNENHYPFSKAFVDVVSFVSGLIGIFGFIFGFITGITSLPYMLTDVTQSPTGTVAWFGWGIPWYVSVPIFIITLLFVYGVYFFVLVNAYRLLYRMGAVHYPRVKNRYGDVESYVNGNRFAGTFFSLLGFAIGPLLLPAFLDLSQVTIEVWLIIAVFGGIIMLFAGFIFVPPIWGVMWTMCEAARETALKIEYKMAERR
jgi:hypothetical protein